VLYSCAIPILLYSCVDVLYSPVTEGRAEAGGGRSSSVADEPPRERVRLRDKAVRAKAKG
jgi:hypothetical protein